jgi:hypothetical protein
MVLHPCSPGGGPLRLRLILDRRKSPVFDPIWEGTRAADPGRGLPPRYRISGPGAGSREPDVGPGAGSREPGAGSREPGAGSREAGHKKTPGDFPRGAVRGDGPLDQVHTGDHLVADHLPGGFGGGFVHAVRDLGPNGVDVGGVAVF